MVRIKTAQAKPKPSPPETRVGRMKRLVLQRARVLIALLVVVLLGWAMQSLWQHVSPQISQRENYLLTERRVTITPPPEWITADVRAEVLRQSGLAGRLSVLDDSFAQIIEDAFALHPWVESVVRITKQYPAGVHVELTYRRPVAVVELVSQNVVQLVPIDRHGVHLPATDVPSIRKRYLPRIGGIVERPPVGQPWTDVRVLGAAEIAVELAEEWDALHLVDILPSARPEVRGEYRYFVYNLITRGGTKIVWGAAPGAAPPTEHSFQEKLQRLKQCTQTYGPLDSVRSPAVVNVRSELAITPRTVKKPEKPSEDEPLVK